MEIDIEAKAIPRHHEHLGNSQPRLLFVGKVWKEWDLNFCIHGEKLRWGCDWCDEYFEEHPDERPPDAD